MTPRRGDTVKVYHRVTLADGTEIECSFGRDPFTFVIGDREVLPAFSKAVMSLEEGETRTFLVPAADAYGEYDPERTRVFRKKMFIKPLEAGQIVTFSGELGEPHRCRVLQEEEDGYVLDMNPLLAGEDLTFEIELVDVIEHC